MTETRSFGTVFIGLAHDSEAALGLGHWALGTGPWALGLAPGQTSVWLAGLGGCFENNARAGAAASSEPSAGPLVSTTYRIDPQANVLLRATVRGVSVLSVGIRAAQRRLR